MYPPRTRVCRFNGFVPLVAKRILLARRVTSESFFSRRLASTRLPRRAVWVIEVSASRPTVFPEDSLSFPRSTLDLCSPPLVRTHSMLGTFRSPSVNLISGPPDSPGVMGSPSFSSPPPDDPLVVFLLLFFFFSLFQTKQDPKEKFEHSTFPSGPSYFLPSSH